MQKNILTLLIVLCSYSIYAQKTISGTVADGNEPIPGVNVLIEGTQNGTVTDYDGKYSIKASTGDMLIFSFVGYKTQVITVNNQNVYNIILEVDQNLLDEVVVVGYGTQKKSDLTGAVTVVDMSEIDKRQVSTIDQALQGQVAGVNVTVNSGSPGGSVMINIRGIGSVNGSEPLYVVDGMMVDDIDFLNSNDVKSIQVLKDASASAIYGSRGSNGVVIISTKAGVDGRAKIDFNTYYGVQNFWRAPPMASASEWAILNNEAKRAAGLAPYASLDNPSSLSTTNWFREISNADAPISSYDLSISGGNEKSTYFVSGGYLNQEGIVDKTDFSRLSFRFNGEQKPKSWLTIGENITLVKTKRNTVLEEEEWNNILITSMSIDPVTPVRNAAGNYSQAIYNDINNPVAAIDYTNNTDTRYRTLANFFADFKIIEGLNFKSNYSAEYSFDDSDFYSPVFFVSPTQQNQVSQIGKYNSSQFINQWFNTLTYNKSFGDHNFKALIGHEWFSERFEWNGITANNVPSDNPDIRFISNATGANAAQVYGSIFEVNQLSFLSRLNYDYKGRYLFTANFRGDSSSKFSDKYKWDYFPSFSFGWKIAKESFMDDIDFISNLKLRAGWGQVGSNGSLPAYQTVTSAATGNNYVWGGILAPGSAFPSSGNDELKWETVTTYNIGLDFEFLNNKLSGSVDYFIKNTEDMILQVPIPAQAGLQEAPYQNAGEMKNTGIELSLNYKNMENEFKYSVGLNFSAIKNEVISLGTGSFIDGALFRENYFVTRTTVGNPIAQFYGFKTDGLFQNQADINAQTAQQNVAPGDVRYVDANNDGNLDFQFLGSPLPDFTYAFNVNFMYKGFDLSVNLQGVQGNKIFNGPAFYTRSSSAFWNLNSEMLNRWTGEGTQNDARYPRMNATDSNNSLMSDRFIEDGSYLRIKTLQLGYTLPQRFADQIGVDKLRFYVNAQNLFTFTKYTGLDPEIGNGQSGTLDIGVDRAFYPQARLFSTGLNVTF